jgi:ribonuclease HII
MQTSGPDLSLEILHAQHLGVSPLLVCGVDEAGRGPWAGPVSAAAVMLDPANLPKGINDSKKLSEAARERLFDEIVSVAVASCVVMIDAPTIDKMNILAATHLAMTQAVGGLRVAPSLALIDGNRAPKQMACPSVTIVKGDALSLSIGAASILAKVTRDRFMVQADRDFPGYCFAKHKGYGVPQHIEALTRLGPCTLHRMSFKPVASALFVLHQGASGSVKN